MEITRENVDEVVRQILQDSGTSYAFKDALRVALQRDPVDAANDAEVLAHITKARCEKIMGAHS